MIISQKYNDRIENKNDVNKNEGYKTASKIQYVARAGNFIKKGYEYKGTLSILKVILNYDYLWTNVRVKGGAYGASCSFLRDGAAYFTSYRDPKLKETIDVYEQVAKFIESFDADEREMTKYIIGTVSGLDTPLSPYAQGQRDFSAYFTTASESGCSEPDSRVAAICKNLLFSISKSVTISVTDGLPSVIVPVLSRTTVLTK